MNLQGDEIGHWVKTTAEKADKLIIVSPFFSVNTEIRSWLEGVPNLNILIGDEFSINNPDTLKELSENFSTDIRCIYRDQLGKRLHAKIFFCTEPSGRCQALVGSANFTVRGLTTNKELAVSFDSNIETDRSILEQIRKWIVKLKDSSLCVDWEQAKLENQKFRDQIVRTDKFGTDHQTRNYWVLKTTAGPQGDSYWENFIKEKVISIGWEDIATIMSDNGIEPREYSLDTLKAAAAEWHETTDGWRIDPNHAARMIHKFSKEFSIHDRVIVCKGYNGNQYADVHLYGLAVVKDCAYYDTYSKGDKGKIWWRLKRSADIRRMDVDIPKEVFTSTLQEKGSLLKTIHDISKEDYERFFSRIQEF